MTTVRDKSTFEIRRFPFSKFKPLKEKKFVDVTLKIYSEISHSLQLILRPNEAFLI